MPDTANIVLTDDNAIDHTLVPMSASLAKATWIGNDAITYAGNRTVEMSLSNPTKSRQTSRVVINFASPMETTVDGLTSVNDTFRLSISGVIPAAATDAEALSFYTEALDLFGDTLVASYLASRRPVY